MDGRAGEARTAFRRRRRVGALVARLVVVLEEPADCVARDSQGDDTCGRVDVGDRVRRDEAAVAREAAGADRQSIRDVRKAPVHRTLDAADDPAPAIGDDEARCGAEVGCDCAHRPNVFLG